MQPGRPVLRAEQPLRTSDRERAALLTLLGDEDPRVYEAVRGRILAEGMADWLRPHALSADPLVRRRVQEILEHLARRAADDRFLGFCLSHGEGLDFEEGAWLLAQTRYPEVNVFAYRALLDVVAGDLRPRIARAASGREVLLHLNDHLFGELGYRGNQEDYYDPENSYLNRVLDRRCGSPVTLCLVYLLVARRLRLPVVGIAMPGHFLCRLQNSTEEVFIDVFHQGRLLRKADCVRYLVQSSFGYAGGFLGPASPRRILGRMCANLHQIYVRLHLAEEAKRLQRYLVALGR